MVRTTVAWSGFAQRFILLVPELREYAYPFDDRLQ
jgi:hypothetical protein